MKKITHTLLALFILATPVQSEELQDNTSVKRIGIEAGLGINIFLPFAQLRASYRLPYDENRWDINLTHSLNVAIGPALYITSLGTKYYFSDSNLKPEAPTFQPFLSGAIGASYYYSSIKTTYNDGGISFPGPAISLGVGTDLHIIENLQLSGGIYTGYPVLFRPEIDVKVRF